MRQRQSALTVFGKNSFKYEIPAIVRIQFLTVGGTNSLPSLSNFIVCRALNASFQNSWCGDFRFTAQRRSLPSGAVMALPLTLSKSLSQNKQNFAVPSAVPDKLFPGSVQNKLRPVNTFEHEESICKLIITVTR